MTMFTKNDKMPESTAAPAANRAVEQPAGPRPQAVAQTMPGSTAPQANMVSIISKALKITGQLESTEDIQVDGQIEGDVRAVTVKVGSSAKVKGAVYGNDVELAGTVEGKIEAKKVVLTSTARMSGDVIHQEITIHAGAFVDGHLRPEFGKADAGKIVPVPKTVVRE
jgi:cytoskeletal protein CcmA (bactofilin family)